jgi:hypothetical protein
VAGSRSRLWRGKPRLYIIIIAIASRTGGPASIRLVDDIVDDSVFLRLLRIHDEVALHVLLYFIQLLAGVLGQ